MERRLPFVLMARSDSVGRLLPLMAPRNGLGQGEPKRKPRKGNWESREGKENKEESKAAAEQN